MTDAPTPKPSKKDIDQIAAALSKAQAAIENPEGSKTVETNSYSYKYTPLNVILDAIKEPLSENGLSFTQLPKGAGDGKYFLETILMHTSGQQIKSVTPIMIGDMNNNNQAFGSALTYMRRYALTSMLGIATEDDDDASAGDGANVRRDKKANDSTFGPLKKTQLKIELERIERDVWAATEESEIDDIMRDSQTIIQQAMRDWPTSIFGDDGDIRGLKGTVKMKRADIQNTNAMKETFGIGDEDQQTLLDA